MFLSTPIKKILAIQVASFALSVQALPQKTCLSVIGKKAYKDILPVKDRTPQVRDAILKWLQEEFGPSVDHTISADQFLDKIIVLNLDNKDITSLKVGDFSGFSSVREIDLSYNKLSDLPLGLFSGLSSVREIDLSYNKLSDLPLGLFSGVSSLQAIWLYDNPSLKAKRDRIRQALPYVDLQF